jgi:tetratricopeptide (TPR) repeat protein
MTADIETTAAAAGSSRWACFLLFAAGLFPQLSSVLYAQAIPARGDAQPQMKQHYEAAFRFQDAGDLSRANSEYKLYLSVVLHRIGNGLANLGDYAHAVPTYEEALGLAPDDGELEIDYAAAALDAADWTKAKTLAASVLDSLSRNAQPPNARAVSELAQALVELGEIEEALRQFTLAEKLKPGFDSSSKLAAAYLVVGDRSNAAKILDEMPEKYGDTATLHMKLGSLYGGTKFFDAAIDEFRKAIAKDDHILGAHYSLGATYMMQWGEPVFDKAEAEFRKELELDPNNALVYAGLGRIAMDRRKYPQAEANLKRAVELDSHNAGTYRLLGQLYKENGKAPEAEAAFRKAIALTLDPSANGYEVEQAHFWLGRLLMESGRKAEGRKELDISRNLLYLKEQQMESRLSGDSMFRISLEKTREADPDELAELKTFEKQSGPVIASSYDNLGVNAANAGEYANASSYFEQAAKWNPALPGIDENWGRAAFAAREYGKAVGPFSRTLALHPADAHLRAMLGLSLCLMHDYARALQVLRPIEEKVEAVPELSIAYAGSMAISGDPQGLARLRSLGEANPAVPLVHYLLGEAYAARKQYSQSADELRVTLKLDPSNAEAKKALVLTDLALGQKTEALQLLSDLAESESRNAEVYHRLAQLQLELGALKDAAQNLENAIRLDPMNAAYHKELADAYRRNAQPEEAEREDRQSEALQAQYEFNQESESGNSESGNHSGAPSKMQKN